MATGYTATGVRILSLGLELEMIATGKSPADIKAAINFARIPGVIAVLSSDGHRLGTPGETWIVTTDRSIAEYDEEHSRNGPVRHGFELISRILYDDGGGELTNAWHAELDDVVAAAGVDAFLDANSSTGYHVHIGVGREGEFTLEEVRKISMFHVIYEETMDDYHADHRSVQWGKYKQNSHISSNRRNKTWMYADMQEILQDLRRATTVAQLTRFMCPGRTPTLGADRQHKLNLVSLELHHTLEFRQHAGTTNVDVIRNWADFCLDFVRRALMFSVDEIAVLNPNTNPLTNYLGTSLSKLPRFRITRPQ